MQGNNRATTCVLVLRLCRNSLRFSIIRGVFQFTTVISRTAYRSSEAPSATAQLPSSGTAAALWGGNVQSPTEYAQAYQAYYGWYMQK